MQQQVESYKMALRDWEEQQQRYRSALQARAAAAAAAAAHNSTSPATSSPNATSATTINNNSGSELQQHSTTGSVAARTWKKSKRSVRKKKSHHVKFSVGYRRFWSEKSKIRLLLYWNFGRETIFRLPVELFFWATSSLIIDTFLSERNILWMSSLYGCQNLTSELVSSLQRKKGEKNRKEIFQK